MANEVTVNGKKYSLIRSVIGDMLMLMIDGKPAMSVPEELGEDFVTLLVHAGAAARFLEENPPKEKGEDKKS